MWDQTVLEFIGIIGTLQTSPQGRVESCDETCIDEIELPIFFQPGLYRQLDHAGNLDAAPLTAGNETIVVQNGQLSIPAEGFVC
ncbi:hypothetical protein HYQ46_009515 [Verticillium longisporum]|nr:hypothetical protein HYQ46_009515 [Verticillium longisporum]